jgi:Alanine racemase, N-terminal domain
MSLHENLDHVGQKIVAAARAAGRDPTAITLVAVSKTVPVERVQEAVRAGHSLFGENYAQELRDKAPKVQGARWHFIGPLQRNKVKYVVGVAELIHSVDSPSLLDEIAARADKLGVVQRCLVQVNVGDESQKSGCAIADLPALVRAFATRPSVRCASRPRACRRDRSLKIWRSWRRPRGCASCRWACRATSPKRLQSARRSFVSGLRSSASDRNNRSLSGRPLSAAVYARGRGGGEALRRPSTMRATVSGACTSPRHAWKQRVQVTGAIARWSYSV